MPVSLPLARAATAEPTFFVDQTGVPVSSSGPLPNRAVSVSSGSGSVGGGGGGHPRGHGGQDISRAS
jgi:hypothetical protein